MQIRRNKKNQNTNEYTPEDIANLENELNSIKFPDELDNNHLTEEGDMQNTESDKYDDFIVNNNNLDRSEISYFELFTISDRGIDFSHDKSVYLTEKSISDMRKKYDKSEKIYTEITPGDLVIYHLESNLRKFYVGVFDKISINNTNNPDYSVINVSDITEQDIDYSVDLINGYALPKRGNVKQILSRNVVAIFDIEYHCQDDDDVKSLVQTCLNFVKDFDLVLKDAIKSEEHLNMPSVKTAEQEMNEFIESKAQDTSVITSHLPNKVDILKTHMQVSIDQDANQYTEENTDVEQEPTHDEPTSLSKIEDIVSKEVKIASGYMSRKLSISDFISNVESKSKEEIMSELKVLLSYTTNRLGSFKTESPVWHAYLRDIRNISVLISAMTNYK